MTSPNFITPGESIEAVTAWLETVPNVSTITIDVTDPAHPQLVCTHPDSLLGDRVFVFPDIVDATGQPVAIA